jgi:hypothetical protein
MLITMSLLEFINRLILGTLSVTVYCKEGVLTTKDSRNFFASPLPVGAIAAAPVGADFAPVGAIFAPFAATVAPVSAAQCPKIAADNVVNTP